jgi:hypothetical protein
MMRVLAAITLPLCLAAAPPATQQTNADQPVSLPEAKTRGSLQSMADLAGLPILHVKNIDEALRLSLKEKQIVLETSLAPTEGALVMIPHFPGVTRVKHITTTVEGNAPPTPPIMFQYDFENRDYTIPHAICRYTTASYTAGTVTLTQMVETLDDQAHSVQLLQHAVPPGEDSPAVSLYVQIEAENVKLQLTANDVLELRRKYPGEVAKYADPIFAALGQEPLLARVDPRLAWQVFPGAFTPAPTLVEKINAVVKHLDAQNFREREAASRQLDSLGQPAALVLMHSPRRGLSEEQISRIDAFIAKYKLASDEEAARLRGSRDFLLDCLSSSEPAIRTAALAQLRTVTRASIPFDVNARADVRAEALANLRSALGTPTTRQLKD